MNKKKIYDIPHIKVVNAEVTKMLCGSVGGTGSFDPDAMP